MSIGCFNDNPAVHALPELLFDYSENIDLEDWNEYLDKLVCRCAEETFNAKYTHFAIQSLGKCYSGPSVQTTYNEFGSSGNCVTVGGIPKEDKFVTCSGDTSSQPCAGGNSTNFVYALEGICHIFYYLTNYTILYLSIKLLSSLITYYIQGSCNLKRILYKSESNFKNNFCPFSLATIFSVILKLFSLWFHFVQSNHEMEISANGHPGQIVRWHVVQAHGHATGHVQTRHRCLVGKRVKNWI